MTKLTLLAEDDRHILITRYFAAPPEAVFRAHTEPALVRTWLLGPPGWTMPVCEIDLRPGGVFRYEWANGEGGGFSITGTFLEIEPHRRLVHIERMHLPAATPDNHITTMFAGHHAGTKLTLRMTLPDEETRNAMLRTAMAEGMEGSYVRLDGLVSP